MLVIKLLAYQWTYIVIHAVGFALLAVFLVSSNDLSFSIAGAITYVLISFIVSYLMVGLKFAEHFPKLNNYYFLPDAQEHNKAAPSDNEWALRKAAYLESGFARRKIFLAPSEDGLICVPLSWFGIHPVTALLGGLVFGFLHLGRFTYLECLGKATIYGLACFFILPHGVLTIVIGHFSTDLLGLVLLKLVRWKLARQTRQKQAIGPS